MPGLPVRLATILALIEPAVGLWLIVGSFVAAGLYQALMVLSAVTLLLKSAEAARFISFERFRRKRKTKTKDGAMIALALPFIAYILLAGALLAAGSTADALPVWARSAFFAASACLFVPIIVLGVILWTMGQAGKGVTGK